MFNVFLTFLGGCELLAKFISGSAKTIVDLRIFAIVANICGGISNFLTGAWIQLAKSILEIFIHFWRLFKTRAAMREVKRAENPEYAIEIIKKLAIRRSFAKDQLIFRKGELANVAYVLQSGTVKVAEPNVILNKGAMFGEMGLFIQDKQRTATIIAIEDVVLLEIPYDSFRKLNAKHPEIGFAVMGLMARRFSANVNGRKQ